MRPAIQHELPEGVIELIAIARIAHRNRNRELEQSATGKLAREYGIVVHFPCCDSVAKDLEAAS